MKHINFKVGIKLFIMVFIFLINILGCTKDKLIAEKNIDTNAILEIKKIVGQNGEIKVLSNSINLSNHSIQFNNDTVKLLSLLEFKSAFDLLNTDSTLLTAILIDSPKNEGVVKSSFINSNVYIDRPKQPGLYRYSFTPLMNGNTSYFSNLNLSFNVGNDGSIIGVPSLYFSGINLFSWQPLQYSMISFNPQTYISTYAVTGLSVFGIQLGGLTIGWSSTITFYIRINTNEFSNATVTIYSKK
ncbi:MAG: hypothetical protein NTW92_06415 [Bacteroidetes bacterium]|nr:hypothetical protein [Bacteroidota bacterium]